MEEEKVVLIPDAELPPATQKLVKALDHVAENARHVSNVRQPAAMIAEALAEYMRTPD